MGESYTTEGVLGGGGRKWGHRQTSNSRLSVCTRNSAAVPRLSFGIVGKAILVYAPSFSPFQNLFLIIVENFPSCLSCPRTVLACCIVRPSPPSPSTPPPSFIFLPLTSSHEKREREEKDSCLLYFPPRVCQGSPPRQSLPADMNGNCGGVFLFFTTLYLLPYFTWREQWERENEKNPFARGTDTRTVLRYLRTVHASQLSRGGGSETRKGRNKLRDGTDGNGACLPTHMQLTSFSFPTRECCFSTHALVSFFSFPGLPPSCWGRSPPPPPPPPRPCCLRTSPGRPGTFWPC